MTHQHLLVVKVVAKLHFALCMQELLGAGFTVCMHGGISFLHGTCTCVPC